MLPHRIFLTAALHIGAGPASRMGNGLPQGQHQAFDVITIRDQQSHMAVSAQGVQQGRCNGLDVERTEVGDVLELVQRHQ